MCDATLPSVDEHGNLPVGVHVATLSEVERCFGKFQRTDRRQQLMTRLRQYVEEIKKAGWNAAVIIDGSFVMSKVDEPDDIDVVLVLPPNWDMAAEVKLFEYNMLSKKRVKKQFGFDVFVVRDASREFEVWTEFFMQVNPKWNEPCGFPEGLKKGLVRIEL